MAPEGLKKLLFLKRVLLYNSAIFGFPGDLRAPLGPSEAKEFGAKISLRLVHLRGRYIFCVKNHFYFA